MLALDMDVDVLLLLIPAGLRLCFQVISRPGEVHPPRNRLLSSLDMNDQNVFASPVTLDRSGQAIVDRLLSNLLIPSGPPPLPPGD